MFETITNLAKKLFGDANERELKRLQPLVEQINAREAAFKALSDADLAAKTAEFKNKIDNGANLDDLLVDAFATVRETAFRRMGMRHYDCQLIGGAALHQGKIAEMRTGEGKTLTATLAVYLNALPGKGAHVVTVNDYLAARDGEWMSPIYNFLGMKVGTILSNERSDQIKRDAYAADITYGTNNEFGFDYLRDNMKFSLDRYVQRGHHFAIVDEVDSILIDEARTPLIISGPMNAPVDLYKICDSVIPLLQEEIDFVVDEKSRSATLTEDGIGNVEQKLGIDNLYDPQNMEVLHHISQSLKAHYLFKRDRDYVVRDGKVVIVDEFTGRLMHGRRWSDGLHQAVEAKEKLTVEQESQTYATITFQNLFRMYDKLSGMTGTAATEAAEFAEIYDLDTLVIPTNKPIARKDHDDVIYKTQMEKFNAAMEEIIECHRRGQPVLVGTTSVEKSEILSQLLRRKDIPHEVLNAKNHGREAHIVAQAGRKGAITISTNMAGRGTDIKLGGNPDELANDQYDRHAQPDEWEAALAVFESQCDAEKKEVLAAGGLHVIGTERHESRRVDNQLRGRSGRQGDPGSSRFYLSLEDDLMRIFGSDKITVWMERMGLQDDEPIEHRWITRAVENAQMKVEGHHFNSRKNLLEYDDVMNYQRKGVYDLRRRALGGENIQEMVDEAVNGVVEDVMDDYLEEGVHPEHWNIEAVRENLGRVLDVTWSEGDDEIRDFSRNEIKNRMLGDARAKLNGVKEAMGEEVFLDFARMLILQFTDDLWKDHLLALDRLRQGVGLRGYGQRNPLLEYKREALQMYLMMNAMRDELLLTNLVHAQAEVAQQASGARNQKATARRLAASNFQMPEEEAPNLLDQLPLAQPVFDAGPPPMPAKGIDARRFGLVHGVRRNDPCPCGSGQKFKKCCYAVSDPEFDAQLEAAAAAAVPPAVEAPVDAGLDAPVDAPEGESADTDSVAPATK
ncbi:MAG: preprotein translocase subunit SecA [Alphaproteobacteria bacterium]|nr:preprotein translocase subunit SecA [Alphaproteobacteria bacterium]